MVLKDLEKEGVSFHPIFKYILFNSKPLFFLTILHKIVVNSLI